MLDEIGFIGGGNMARAIIGSLRQGGSLARIRVVDPDPEATRRLADLDVESVRDLRLLRGTPVLVLAVKPQVLPLVVPDLHDLAGDGVLLISILAGIPTGRLEAQLPSGWRVVRAMPNTPMAIGCGMVALCGGLLATAADLATARDIFALGAEVIEVKEVMMDAVTAVSGSGPAYCFYVAEAMQAAACQLGFDQATAALLVGQTLTGAIAYLRYQDGFPAAELRRQVTSPGGTTAAAILVLEEAGVQEVFIQAIRAAAAQAAKLSGNP